MGLVLTAGLVLGLVSTAYGATDVRVMLPDFKVSLNGERFDNDYSQYPLLVYKGITYFPMTYNDCRFLGLETEWKGETKGLFIETTGVTAAYNPYRGPAKNSLYQIATVSDFPITVNAKGIDNSQEQYPLLSFRNITYFPMTWDYGVGEFGWDYHFDTSDGLVINSDNKKLEQKQLPDNRAKNEDRSFKDNIAVSSDYIYYQDDKGQIMQLPLNDTAQSKAVYQLPLWNYGDGKTLVYAALYSEGGQVFLSYHSGGATMGTDYLIRLNDDGTTTLISDTRYIIKTFADKSFKYWAGPAPGPQELYVKEEDGEWRQLGHPDYLYGWAWHTDGKSSGGSPSKDVYLIGDDLYILGFDIMSEDEVTTGIYKININSNETVRITAKEVAAFIIEGDYIYYPSGGGIYRYSWRDGQEELLGQPVVAPNHIGNFSVLNGNIYWQDGLNQNLYNLKGENLNPLAQLDGMRLAGDNDEYLVVTFAETPQSRYRTVVFDRSSEVVFKTSDRAQINSVHITGDKIYFYNISSGSVCIGRLN